MVPPGGFALKDGGEAQKNMDGPCGSCRRRLMAHVTPNGTGIGVAILGGGVTDILFDITIRKALSNTS